MATGKFKYVYIDPVSGASGSTPYGIYDADVTFTSESIQVCKWVARRLGYPTMQLEFGSGSIYAMFEESVSEYSQHINNYNIKNWMWDRYGADTTISGTLSTGSNQPIMPHMGFASALSKQYGQAAGVGGDVTLYTGSLTLTSSQQVYDIPTEASFSNNAHSESKIEIQRVFNEGPAAITRFYDPYAGSYDQKMMLEGFGFGQVSPGIEFIMRPISYDVARAQAIETSDRIRKSAYSFELINNQIRIFPMPQSSDDGNKMWFNYYVRDELNTTVYDYMTGSVSDPSNVPYEYITYAQINGPGRQWIRKYTLALSKELLGIVRSKYQTMPIPGGEVTMDGEGLKAEGREEKTLLLDELKEFLESVTLSEKARAESEQAEAQQQLLSKSPLGIYLG